MAGLRGYVRQQAFALLGAPFYRFGHQSFSQAGEDCILRFLFADCGMPLGQVSYLDIGSRHPTAGSNTCMLYLGGARGVCVDADSTFIPLFRKMRPRDKVLNVGISIGAGESLPLYFMEGGGSTLSLDEADKRVALGGARVVEVRQVEVMNINSLIREEFDPCPTFLSIDIESLDLPVLQTLDLDAFPIPVICVETCRYSDTHVRPKDLGIAAFLSAKGYEAYADTYINTIFVRTNWFHGQHPGSSSGAARRLP